MTRLTRIYTLFTRGYDGLELAWFVDAQHALENYIVMANIVGGPQVRTGYESRLDKLAPALKAYAAKPTTEDALVISESVRWLQNAHQAPALVASDSGSLRPSERDRPRLGRTCGGRYCRVGR